MDLYFPGQLVHHGIDTVDPLSVYALGSDNLSGPGIMQGDIDDKILTDLIVFAHQQIIHFSPAGNLLEIRVSETASILFVDLYQNAEQLFLAQNPDKPGLGQVSDQQIG
jgi:hypothetical protein